MSADAPTPAAVVAEHKPPARSREPRQLRSAVAHWSTIAVLGGSVLWMAIFPAGYERLLRVLVPAEDVVLYPSATPAVLIAQQLQLVAISGVIALVLGAVLGVFALSRFGRPFRDIIVSLGNLVQAVPTVAIIMLAIPAIGYGATPVIIGLIAYSILPIVLNIIVGIESVSPDARDAARGVGMSAAQRLMLVEVPLALPVILGGIKNMLVINMSAATVGAVASAGGLGQAILAGFASYNTAFIIEGALPVALLALLVDRLLTPQPSRG